MKRLNIIVLLGFIAVFFDFAMAENIQETWCYLMPHEAKKLKGNEPITDYLLFSARVNYQGKLYGLKKRPQIKQISKNSRVHLVVALIYNSSRLYMVLDRNLPFRKKLLRDIVEYSKEYDGLQIDFEGIPNSLKKEYLSFLRELKNALPKDKIFSVAIPARTKHYSKSPYDYYQIGRIADKVFIMAYDQHWGNSKPGPVASLEWCEKIVKYSTSAINKNKLIMGIPFYSRAWESKNHGRSLNTKSLKYIPNYGNIIENNVNDDNPNLKYKTNVTVTVYYETNRSLMNKVKIYDKANVRGIGFWRLGQEPEKYWDHLRWYYQH